MRVLLLHPGEMGESVGAALAAARHEVLWVTEGRSIHTRTRAEKQGFFAIASVEAAAAQADVVFSICPPDAALDVAGAVKRTGFSGCYVDGNAISPGTAQTMAEMIGDGFVDGGIIGPPAWRPGAMRFYLSGRDAAEVAALFKGTLVDARVCGDEAGAASALKMAYAAYTKGSAALVLGVRALAEFYGVAESLVQEWGISQPRLNDMSVGLARQTSRKAWRFAGEMAEIAETFKAAGLPDGFHRAAEALYARLAGYKDREVDIETLVAELLEDPEQK